MKEFIASLQRERFTVLDPNPFTDQEPLVALSNRIAVPLIKDGVYIDNLTVRTQNVHSCIRMAAKIVEMIDEGRIDIRELDKVKWDKLWKEITAGFETKFNPKIWVALYHKGKLIFSKGEHHDFLDVIEGCDFKRKDGNYADSIDIAKQAFTQAGRPVIIDYDIDVAMHAEVASDHAACQVVLRNPQQTQTVSFTAKPKHGRDVRVPQCLSICAIFLEGVQQAFLAGVISEKIRLEIIPRGSEEAKQADGAAARIKRLDTSIYQFEKILKVKYDPGRPDFFYTLEKAEEFARKHFGSQ